MRKHFVRSAAFSCRTNVFLKFHHLMKEKEKEKEIKQKTDTAED